jgi:hypothetical protein
MEQTYRSQILDPIFRTFLVGFRNIWALGHFW